jgi:hypothetical protein
MKTLKYLFTLSLILGSCFAATAARDTAKERKFEELRNAILIEKLALTAQEQKDFLPLYKEYKDKEKLLIKQIRSIMRNAQKTDISEIEAKKMLTTLKNLNQQKADLHKSYTDKFLTVLPAQKVLKLYAVEREIRKILMSKIKERKGSGKGKP